LLREVSFELKIWYGRPSGHSTTYTIVGTFDSGKKARRVATALKRAIDHEKWTDWEPDDASVNAHGNEVRFSVYSTEGHPGDLEKIVSILDEKKPNEVDTYENAQELYVAFEFDSHEAKLNEIKVLLLLKHPFLEPLMTNSKVRVERTNDGKTLCSFEYMGDSIYDSEERLLLEHSVSELGCTVSESGEP
jgi:hypothetical protein